MQVHVVLGGARGTNAVEEDQQRGRRARVVCLPSALRSVAADRPLWDPLVTTYIEVSDGKIVGIGVSIGARISSLAGPGGLSFFE